MAKKVVQSHHRTLQERTPDPAEYGPGDVGWTPLAKRLLIAVIIGIGLFIVILANLHHVHH